MRSCKKKKIIFAVTLSNFRTCHLSAHDTLSRYHTFEGIAKAVALDIATYEIKAAPIAASHLSSGNTRQVRIHLAVISNHA